MSSKKSLHRYLTKLAHTICTSHDQLEAVANEILAIKKLDRPKKGGK